MSRTSIVIFRIPPSTSEAEGLRSYAIVPDCDRRRMGFGMIRSYTNLSIDATSYGCRSETNVDGSRSTHGLWMGHVRLQVRMLDAPSSNTYRMNRRSGFKGIESEGTGSAKG